MKDHLAQKNGPKIYNLQKEITELHQGETSITNFFTQLKVLWDQLQNNSPFPSCTCGKCTCNVNKRLNDLQSRESVMKFLMGINDYFLQVRTQILLMDPFPSLNKVYSLMIQEEAQSLLLIVPIQGLNQLPWLPNHRMSMSILGLIMLETMGMKEKISQFAPIVVSLVTPLISAISYMDSTLITSSRAKFQWHIK